MWIGILISYVSFLLLSLFITVFAWVFVSRLKLSTLQVKAKDVLHIIKASKTFPIDSFHGWSLLGTSQGCCVWKNCLKSPIEGEMCLLNTYGGCTKIAAPPCGVLQFLRNIKILKEWDTFIYDAVLTSTESPSGTSSKHYCKPLVKSDLVSAVVETTCPLNWNGRLWIYWLKSKFVFQKQQITRYWHREVDGSCWLFQYSQTWGEWWFFLAQPQQVSEIERSKVMVVYCPGANQAQWPFSNEVHKMRIAEKLTCVQEFFKFHKQMFAPIIHLNLTGVSDKFTKGNVRESPEHSRQLSDDSKYVSGKNVKRRIRNSVRCKYNAEGKSSLSKASPNKSVAENCPQKQVMESSENTTEQSDIFLKPDGGETESTTLTDSVEPLDTYDIIEEKDYMNKEEDGSVVRHRTNSLPYVCPDKGLSEKRLKLLPFEDQEVDNAGSKTLRAHVVMACNLPLDGDGCVHYKTLANQTAAEVLAETFKVSDIDISRPYDEQAQTTGGWVFFGMDRDVVILRKIYEESCPMLSFIGKGIIRSPPKEVWNCLQNPLTRFTYDEQLKKLEVVKDLGNGMKIVHMHHEVVQIFRREARDFCVLQSERLESNKRILCLHSVDHKCFSTKLGSPLGLFFSSGWVIEPVRSDDGKLLSMVTYFVQMELGDRESGGFMVDEIAAKQPTSIALLRQYLADPMF